MFKGIVSRDVLVILAVGSLVVQPESVGGEPKVKVMAISRAAEPVPALGHRLLPLESELTPGDAAPIYLRLCAGLSADALAGLEAQSKAWLALPLDQFPVKAAREFLEPWRPKLAQLEYAANRETCSWNYTIAEEQEHIMDLVLADAESMRAWARLLALEARLEIADRQFARAAHTIQTGISFSRQVGDGPFFINVLIGHFAAGLMFDEVEVLISQSDAPCLYWSLTALPRPMIGIRKSVAQEYKICERLLPEMTNLDGPRSDAEWAGLMERFHGRILRIRAMYQIAKDVDAVTGKSVSFRDDLGEFKKWALPAAIAWFDAGNPRRFARVDDEIILKFFGKRYRELYDEMYKAAYLPYFEAAPYYERGQKQLRAAKDGPLAVFTQMIANVEAVHRQEALLDRKIAMLRVVEALRLDAGVTGRLADSLDKVKVVPVPSDPLSGKPFIYSAKGESASLSGAYPEGSEWLGLIYQITLRK